MTIETLRTFLGWCALINMGLLLWWFLFFYIAHDWLYGFHGRVFQVPVASFDSIHYIGMVFFQMGIFLFNLVPYLALRCGVKPAS